MHIKYKPQKLWQIHYCLITQYSWQYCSPDAKENKMPTINLGGFDQMGLILIKFSPYQIK